MWAPRSWRRHHDKDQNWKVLKEEGGRHAARDPEDDQFSNLGVWCSNGYTYVENPEFYWWYQEFSHWAEMPAFLFSYKPVDVRLQIAFQLHQQKLW